MRNETSLANEVRVKLHMKCSQDTQIRNLWMCLNYDQKPSVSHIVEHIKKNFCSKNEKKTLSTAEPEVKLYLDDFWLPPYENSRLIRENDCVKVELNYDDEVKNYSQDNSNVSKTNTKANYTRNWDQTVKSSDYKHDEANGYTSSRAKAANSDYYDEQVDEYENGYENEEDYYYHYYDNNDEEAYTYGRREDTQGKYHNHNQQRSNSFDPFEFWSSNIQTNHESKEKPHTKNTTNTTKPKQQHHQVKEIKKANASSKHSEAPATTVNCYKKFAVASYAHLLNEPVEPTTTAKSTTATLQKQKTSDQNQKQQVSSNEYVNLDKIASDVNSTGKQKWKNSTKPTQPNGPKHIIFPSTESDSSSSSSSSSDSSDDETTTTTATMAKKKQTASTHSNKKETTAQAKTTTNQAKKPYYEPTKEEQLNTVNTNRSYTVQNTKSLNDFKKIFNETKLNAPKAEDFTTTKKQNQPKEKSKHESSSNKKQNTQLNTSTDSTTSTSSSSSSTSSAHQSPSKKNNHRRKSTSPAKVDFEKLTKLEGMPRVNDKLAFQILEISSNFTPEISAYKTGTVLDVDITSNEITIRLNNKYNSVLKRPNKFNVVLDETEEERMESAENESAKMKRQNSNDNDNILKIDWRNLMNLKLLPEETKKEADKSVSLPVKPNEQPHQTNNQHVKPIEAPAVAAAH